MAVNAHPLVKTNLLYLVPRTRPDRRWFTFDYVDPAPKFRRMPPDYDWRRDEPQVPAGDDESVLVDEPERGTIPVLVTGYQCVHKQTRRDRLLIITQSAIPHNSKGAPGI